MRHDDDDEKFPAAVLCGIVNRLSIICWNNVWQQSRSRKATSSILRKSKVTNQCCSANLHSGYAVSLGVTQLALQRHEVPETIKITATHTVLTVSTTTTLGPRSPARASFAVSTMRPWAVCSGIRHFYFGKQILNVSRSWEVPPRRNACPLLAQSRHRLRGLKVCFGGKTVRGPGSHYRIAGVKSAVCCRVCVALEILRSVSRVTIFSGDRRDYSDRGAS